MAMTKALDLDRLDQHDVKPLWANGWWDVPLSGMVLYRGEHCWFRVIRDPDEDSPIKYEVLRLTAEQQADELYWHRLFVQHVGDHFEFDGWKRKQPHQWSRPSGENGKFYEPYSTRKHPDYSKNERIGWFEWRH